MFHHAHYKSDKHSFPTTRMSLGKLAKFNFTAKVPQKPGSNGDVNTIHSGLVMRLLVITSDLHLRIIFGLFAGITI